MKTLNTPLGICGILYLVFGVVMTTWMFVSHLWPTYIFFISIGVGFFLLFLNRLTEKLSQFKLIQLIIGAAPLFAFYLFIQVNKPSQDIFLVAEGFTGAVVIIYGQKEGVKKEFENDKRLYRIPSTGVLRTQFELKGESVSPGKYYFVTDNHTRTKIEHIPFKNTFPDSTEVYVHYFQMGVAKDLNGNVLKFQQASIGKKNDTLEADINKLIQ